jgi:HAD superfamily hydrolase (TIGR01450 family)
VNPAGLRAADVALAHQYDVALLDLDGVVYVGPHAVPGATDALQQAGSAGMRLAYVTNNASRPPAAVAAHLRSLGVPARDDEVVTSAQAAARVVAELVPPGARVLVVGGEGLRVALGERGLVPVATSADAPAAVVQGFAPEVGWALLAEGAYALARGVPWVASNTDLTIPTPAGRAPGNGTLVEVLRLATGRSPVVAGKPETTMHREAVLRTGATRPLVVGDRLDTDIEGATRAGVDSLLVLTGVTDAAGLVLAPPHLRPTFVAADLGGLLQPHPPTRWDDGWCCGQAVAVVHGGLLRVTAHGGDPLDVVRASCAAVWNTPGAVEADGVGEALASVLP